MIMGGIGVAILLAIGLGFLLRRGTPPVDPALAAADDVALQLLKRDDTESIKKAIEAWEALEAKAPEYIAAKANQIIAQVLLTQDLRDEQHRLEAHRNAVDKEIKRLTDAKQPEDWEQRVTAKREEMVQLKKLYDPLIDEASKRDERAGALLKASKALVEKNRIDHIAVMRASAVYYAAKMSDTAERLADSYRKAAENGRKGVLHDDTRAWADFAMAMLDAQPRLSAEKRDRALASIAATRQKDPALLRSYLFEAKVRLASKEWALAKKAIADLRAANPNHSAALKMLAEIEQAEAAAAKAAAEAAAIPQQ